MVREIRECKNPNCQNLIEPIVSENGERVWRRIPRKFCSDQCQRDNWILNQAAKLHNTRNGQRDYSARRQKLRDSAVRVGELAPIPLDQLVRIVKVWDRLKHWDPYKRLKRGDSQGRVKGEIVPPEANLGEVS